VSPQALAAASAQLDWPPLCVVFSAMVLDLYLWDCVEKACVRSCAIRGVPGAFATKASKSWKVICSIRFRLVRQSVAPDRSIISLPQLAQRSAKEIFETNLTRVRRLCEAAERCKPGELQWVQSRRFPHDPDERYWTLKGFSSEGGSDDPDPCSALDSGISNG